MRTRVPQCGHREDRRLFCNRPGQVPCHQVIESPHRSPSMSFANDWGAFETTNLGASRNRNSIDTDTPTRIRPGTQAQWEKKCPKCEQWIGLGMKGSPYALLRHLDGERCRRAAELKTRAEDALGIPAASTSFGPTSPPAFVTPLIPSHPHILTPKPTSDRHSCGPSESLSAQVNFPHSDIPRVVTLSPLSPFASLPSLILSEQTSTSPTMSDAMELDILQVPPTPRGIIARSPPITSFEEQAPCLRSPTITKVPCHGVRLKWECGHSSRTYPFQYHDTDNPTWSVMTRRPPDPDVIYLQSFSCALFHDTSMEACFECLKIPSSDKFQALVLKASKDPAPTVPWGYLSWEQISKRLKDRTNECRRYRKKVGSTPLLQA